jgi:hypothetical protein
MIEPQQPNDPSLADEFSPESTSSSSSGLPESAAGGQRRLVLPWEGVEALRTVLGILDDHDVPVDAEAYQSISVTLLNAVMMGPQDGDILIEVSLAEADLLLIGLRFTDVMSMDLPFYDMVVNTINFVGEQLLAMWTSAEWLAFHDNKYT